MFGCFTSFVAECGANGPQSPRNRLQPYQRYLRGLYGDCLPTLFVEIRSPCIAFFDASLVSDSFGLPSGLI
jgi:hypothetical protein